MRDICLLLQKPPSPSDYSYSRHAEMKRSHTDSKEIEYGAEREISHTGGFQSSSISFLFASSVMGVIDSKNGVIPSFSLIKIRQVYVANESLIFFLNFCFLPVKKYKKQNKNKDKKNNNNIEMKKTTPPYLYKWLHTHATTHSFETWQGSEVRKKPPPH